LTFESERKGISVVVPPLLPQWRVQVITEKKGRPSCKAAHRVCLSYYPCLEREKISIDDENWMAKGSNESLIRFTEETGRSCCLPLL